jgi:putative membrane protein
MEHIGPPAQSLAERSPATGKSRVSRLSSLFKALSGVAAIAYLALTVDFHRILPGLLQARWALLGIFLFHFVQLAFCATAWQMQFPGRQLWRVCFRMRWIREGTGSLLPVGALSAAALGSRLLCRYGISGAAATASVAVDLAAEMGGQLAFLVCGIALLPIGSLTGQKETWLMTLFLGVMGMCAAFIVAQRVGLFRLLDLAVGRLRTRWPNLPLAGKLNFHEALITLHAQRQRLVSAVMLHSLSWGLGAVEAWLALLGLGHGISWRCAFILESIGMAARSVGFAIPGAVGVQEAGFALAGSLIGIPAELAIACSLLTRGREFLVAATSLVVLGREELQNGLRIFRSRVV